MPSATVRLKEKPMAAQRVLENISLESNPERCWDAVLRRDRSLDGAVFYAVRTTGVFCKPSCPSRRPDRANVVFFNDPGAAEKAGFRPCRRCRPEQAQSEDAVLVRRACDFIDRNLDGTLTAPVLRAGLGLSIAKLNRAFRKILGISAREYADARRFELFRANLTFGRSVADATYEAGYNSSRAAYENVSSRLGMTPAAYRERGKGVAIRYATAATPLGRMAVAATNKGICRIAFAESDQKLIARLEGEFPRATLTAAPRDLAPLTSALNAHIEAGGNTALELPLDIHVTAFQRRVYRELKKIPAGQTRSYAEVARAIGQPTACRAVARACATNPVAVAIPCHRVIGSNGALTGYRWGVERKRELLGRERQSAQASRE